jgi:hypothetical protein
MTWPDIFFMWLVGTGAGRKLMARHIDCYVTILKMNWTWRNNTGESEKNRAKIGKFVDIYMQPANMKPICFRHEAAS